MRSNAAKTRDDIINSEPQAVKRKHPWLSFKTVQNMSDAELQQAGFIMPPFHFHCRTTTVAVDVKPVDDAGALNEMAASGVDWSKTKPFAHSREAQNEIVTYGKSKDVNVYAVSKFDGDIDILKEQIDVIGNMAKEYGITKKITVAFENMDDDDFAITVNNTITFNTKALRNREITNAILNADNYLASTDVTGIAAHEMGHIIARQYGNKGIEIAKKAYYNVFGREISNNEILLYLKENVSRYSVDINDIHSKKKIKLSQYKEVISEVLAKNFTNPTKFTSEFIRVFREDNKK